MDRKPLYLHVNYRHRFQNEEGIMKLETVSEILLIETWSLLCG